MMLWTGPPDSFVKGFSQQEYWSGLFPPPGDLPDPGMEPTPPALAGRFFTTEPPWEALIKGNWMINQPKLMVSSVAQLCLTLFDPKEQCLS